MCSISPLSLPPTPPCPRASLGGVQGVGLIAKSDVALQNIVTHDKQMGAVVLVVEAGEIANLPILEAVSTFNEVIDDNLSGSYTTTLQFSIALPDVDSRDWLERLDWQAQVCTIVTDANGKMWLMGEYNGVAITYTRVSDTPGGTGRYEVVAKCRSAYPCREIHEIVTL